MSALPRTNTRLKPLMFDGLNWAPPMVGPATQIVAPWLFRLPANVPDSNKTLSALVRFRVVGMLAAVYVCVGFWQSVV